MKKALIIVLIIVLTAGFAGVCTVAVFNQMPDTAFAIITDTHVLAAEQIGESDKVADFVAFAKKGQKMLSLTEAIMDSTVDRLIRSKPSAVLIPGDLTDDGSKISHLTMASQLKRLEDAGIPVFVIPGDHDVLNNSFSYVSGESERIDNVSVADFASIYKDFGYGEALARHPDSLSYTADLKGNYRLIAIDVANHDTDSEGIVQRKHNPNMTSGLLAWCAAQIREAVAAGKTPISLMHFPSLVHMGPLVDKLGIENDTVNDPELVREAFTEAGLHYVFTGHVHMTDTAAAETKNGKLYDFGTSALSNYPCAIRYFEDFDGEINVRTIGLSAIDAKYLPTYVDAETRAAVTKDLQTYAYDYVTDSMLTKIYQKIDVSTLSALLRYLGVDGTARTTLAEDMRANMIDPFFNLKLYKKDAAEGELSVESIVNGYGLTLPASRYKNVKSFAMSIVNSLYKGDESFEADGDNATILRYVLSSAFYMIDRYDLFGRIKAVNPAFADIDLGPSMEILYKDGKLELLDNNLLAGILKSVPKLGELLGSSVENMSGQAILGLLKYMKTIELMGIKPLQFVDFEAHSLDLSAIINALVGDLGAGLTNDFSCPDNNLKINKTTLEWSKA